MNIGMLLDKEFYGDLRVENEVQALSQAGFNVFVFCFSFGGISKADEYFGAKIIHIPVSKKLVYKLRGLINTLFNFYPYYVVNLIKKYLVQYKIDVLHIHDLYLFQIGLILKKKNPKLILVGDLHENYVEGLKHYKFANTFPGNWLISIKKWENKEIEWCKNFDCLITVIEEAVDRYTSLGILKEKIFVVSNYVNLDSFQVNEFENTILEKFKNFRTLTYVGGFDIHRGLESAIKAVPIIIKHISNFKLVFVGEGANLIALKSLSKKLEIENYISFEGWQHHSKLPSYIKAADICLIPHLKTQHTDNTIPHKLFQYMLMGKPVIASNCNPIKRILNEVNAGLIYEANNEKYLAEKVIEIFNDQNKINAFGENGKNAVLEKYNWNATSKNLIKLFKNIETKNG
ncbi:MAG: glycosyltransferase family 4 protein [Ignavibacteriae bacterium]|nr:glycosyltransferase family 4 protein [Ignavibacteriota bacterium]